MGVGCHQACKGTPKQGPSISGVDWDGLKSEMAKHGPSLMEVEWGGKIEANHTSGCMLSEVDWGAHDSSFSL